MADVFTVALKITVNKGDELVDSTEHTFESISFSKMANAADTFFEMIEKIQKKM